jgi:hypothetical protein
MRQESRERAEMMICALTHDDPVNDCPDRPLGPVVGIVLLAIFGVATVAALTLRTRRRRKVHAQETAHDNRT